MTGDPPAPFWNNCKNQLNHSGDSNRGWWGSHQEVQWGKRIEVAQLITGENLEVQAVERSYLRVVSGGERGGE